MSFKNETPVGINGLLSPTTTQVTLTTANTAYKIPSSELSNRKTIIIYNGSDTDVYLGSSSVTTSNGILLASGEKQVYDCESNLYAVCGSDNKQLNVLELS